MITVIYSTHKDEEYNKKFKNRISNSIGVKNYQILEYINHNQYSLSEVYNKGISESIYDIVVCVHNDIKLESGWGKKILKDFKKNDDFSIIGKAGSCYFPESGVYWERMSTTMVGQVYHEPIGQKKWLSRYSSKFPFLIPVVTIDGLFISFNKKKIKHKFDETISGFHFYDHGFCIPNYMDGVKIGVTTSFDITHESIGAVGDDFHKTRLKFIDKYKTKLPLDLKPVSVYYEKTNPKKIKSGEKIAVVIPTKGIVDVLIRCLDSFYDNCDESNFQIFIADTGSTDKEKEIIKKYISFKKNITLIEYDWYQFSKTNNHVVRDYVTNDYQYILFANNDIQILNDVIYKMWSVFNTNHKVGTVGSRLHFEDNTLQHGSVILQYFKEINKFTPTHEFFKSYYNFSTGVKECFGNTAALMMIRKKIFDDIGGFDESFLFHFEDVDLNFKCLKMGLKNYFDGSSVSYHFESTTKKLDSPKITLAEHDHNLLNYKINQLNIINKPTL